MIERDRLLRYCKGYKYQVRQDYHIKLEIVPIAPIVTQFVEMDLLGNTVIKSGYAWDGASGPTWDSLSSIIGSLVHDVLYQLIRLGFIEMKYKEYADQTLHDLCTEDGMTSWRADYWRWAVLEFGTSSCRPSAEPEILIAP